MIGRSLPFLESNIPGSLLRAPLNGFPKEASIPFGRGRGQYPAHEMPCLSAFSVNYPGELYEGMDAVLQTQIARLEVSIKRKNFAEFQKSYDSTLNTCNGRHSETGHKLIQIIQPTAPPVANQKWEMSKR